MDFAALVVDGQGVLTDAGMPDVVRRARELGFATALLSNADGPLPAGWRRLVDVAVLSGEVGLRKPHPEIFALCAGRLGVPPQRCVFVDDAPVNVRAAATVGMTAVLHRGIAQTCAELHVLLGVELSPTYEDAATRATGRTDLRGAP